MASGLARAAFRGDYLPVDRGDYFGFRVVLCMRQD
jgi:hypothetical protein